MEATDEEKDDACNHTTQLPDKDKAAKLRHNVTLVYCTSATHMFSLQLGMQATTKIWLDHFKGDFAAQAGMMSGMMSFTSACGLIVNPIFASLCDVIGRKPVMLSGLCFSTFSRLLCAVSPTTASLLATSRIQPLAMGHQLGSQTVLGDCFKGDGVGYGGAQSKMMVGMVAGSTICPLLGGWLVQRFGVSAPYAMSALIEAGTLITEWLFLHETLDDDGSAKAFKFKSASPFSFLKLFRESKRLSLLTVMHMLNFACDKMSTFQVLEIYRQEIFSYSMKDRAQFMSISSLVALPGYASAGAFMQRFGTSVSLWLGLGMYMLENFIMSRSRSLRTFYLILPLGLLRSAAGSSISAMMQDEVKRVGMKQGEFQGCLSNIRTLSMVITPLLWARIYGYGSRRGKPQLFLYIIMLSVAAQLLIERMLSSLGDPAAAGKAVKPLLGRRGSLPNEAKLDRYEAR